MVISSRTPEGDPNQCPICGHHVRIEPSIDTRDAPCPSCGHLLWFAQHPSGAAIERAERQPIRVTVEMKQLVLEFATKRFGMPAENVRAAFDKLEPTKFQKMDWDAVLRARDWNQVLALVNAVNP